MLRNTFHGNCMFAETPGMSSLHCDAAFVIRN